jgi:hypothetical protein
MGRFQMLCVKPVRLFQLLLPTIANGCSRSDIDRCCFGYVAGLNIRRQIEVLLVERSGAQANARL